MSVTHIRMASNYSASFAFGQTSQKRGATTADITYLPKARRMHSMQDPRSACFIQLSSKEEEVDCLQRAVTRTLAVVMLIVATLPLQNCCHHAIYEFFTRNELSLHCICDSGLESTLLTMTTCQCSQPALIVHDLKRVRMPRRPFGCWEANLLSLLITHACIGAVQCTSSHVGTYAGYSLSRAADFDPRHWDYYKV